MSAKATSADFVKELKSVLDDLNAVCLRAESNGFKISTKILYGKISSVSVNPIAGKPGRPAGVFADDEEV